MLIKLKIYHEMLTNLKIFKLQKGSSLRMRTYKTLEQNSAWKGLCLVGF